MYLITNRQLCDKGRYLEVLNEASYCGIKYIILREKDLSNDELEDLYNKVKGIVSKDCKIIINNNLEVFNRVKGDGIHLSFDSYIDYFNRGMLNLHKLIGVSTHSTKEIKEIAKRKADYVFLSHIYETKCKEDLEPKGLGILKEGKEITKGSGLKLVALGGILPSNVRETLKYCDDIAVMSTIMKSDNICKTINEYII